MENLDEGEIIQVASSSSEASPDVSSASAGEKRKHGPEAIHLIWEYYKDSNDKKDKICLIYNHLSKGRYSTNAENHLLKKHPEKRKEYEQKKKDYEGETSKKKMAAISVNATQSKLSSYFFSPKSGMTCTPNQLCKLAICIASTSLPFSVVSSAEFNEFCQSLFLNFACPDKKKVLKEIQVVYSKMKQNTLSMLLYAGKIMICIDEWTKKGMTMSIIGMTAHFFDKKAHRLEQVLLGLRRIEHPRTAALIKEKTFSLVEEWDIPQWKIWRIITDNAKNMVKAFRTEESESSSSTIEAVMPASIGMPIQLLGPNMEEEDFNELADDEYIDGPETDFPIDSAFDKSMHLPCFLHTLVLAYKKPVNSDDFGASEIKNDACCLAASFSHSAKVMEKLIELSGKKLLLPAPTHWNYHYHVFRRLIDLKEHVTAVCEEQGINNLQNWRCLKQLVQVLEPFAKWIDYLQGVKYPTIAHALPCLNKLLEHLADLERQDVFLSLCNAITMEIHCRFEAFMDLKHKNYNSTYIVVNALHPILALSLNDVQLASACQEITVMVKKEPAGLLATEAAAFSEPSTRGEQESGISEDMFPHLKKKIQEAKQRGVNAVSSVEEEVTMYFKQLAAFSNVKDEMEFWIDHQLQFPALSTLACDVLAISASSAAIESVFSIAGHATSGRRHNLSAHLETEVVIKVNKRFM